VGLLPWRDVISISFLKKCVIVLGDHVNLFQGNLYNHTRKPLIPSKVRCAITLGKLNPSYFWKVVGLLPWISPGEKKTSLL